MLQNMEVQVLSRALHTKTRAVALVLLYVVASREDLKAGGREADSTERRIEAEAGSRVLSFLEPFEANKKLRNS